MQKIILLAAFSFLFFLQIDAQKTTTLANTLNLSKSNEYRIMFDSKALTNAQAEALLADVEKSGINVVAKMKSELPSRLKAAGVNAANVKFTDVYYAQSSSNCESCTTKCKGSCVSEGNGSCVCLKKSENAGSSSSMKSFEAAGPLFIVVLSDPALESKVFAAPPTAATKKSE